MNPTLVKALILLVPVLLLLAWSVVVTVRTRTSGAVLQLVGAVCLLVVVLTHIAEAMHLFSQMQWGDRYSAGHYVDLSSAVLGIALVLLGYFVRARTRMRR